MTAQVIYFGHVLTPHRRRAVYCQPQAIRRLAPGWQRPYIALLNGQAVLRADWGREIKSGDLLAFVDARAIPQDGGGGGSDPVKMVAMIAVMYFTMGAGAGVWANVGNGMMTTTGQLTFTGTMVGAGMMVAGSALVNALIPPPKPPTPMQAASLAAPSPTYSLQAQGNGARLEAAIPEHFGRMLAYPDFAAQPYAEFSGNEQYLYQLLCVGRGEYDIEAVRIEDTAIASFDEISYEVVAPNGVITLFPANVISSLEVSGQSPDCRAGTYARSGNTVTVTLAGHGLAGGKQVYLDFTSGGATDGSYAVVSAQDADTFTATDTASGATSGTVTVSPWVGGFIASAAGTQANYLGLDFVLARGLYYANDNGSLANASIAVAAYARTVDDNGAPTSAWAALGAPTYTAATTTPQRYSERYGVAAGRYEVRVRRTDIKQTDARYGHEIAWAGMRAYLPETRVFGDVTLLAMRLRASNNLSMQGSRKINVIATRKLPVWNGGAWSANTATRSIAWPIAYACKQMGLTDAQIDLATLLALDATWAARGDYFDGRFDSFLSFWEAVTKMAGAGRAKPYMQGGVVRVVRDQAASIPVALFSVRNIVKGSFSIDYLMPAPDTADAIDVGYFDKYIWAPRRVRAKLPGSAAAKPVKVELFGVSDRDQAFREGMYQAACNRYRRKHIKFATEMEGFIPSFGDLIAVQHDMPAWGQGGEVTGWDAGTRTATLSEPVAFGGGTNYLALRKLDGSVDGPYVVTAGAQSNRVVFADAPAYTPYTGTAQEKTHFAFGSGNAYLLARVLSVRPRSLTQVEIEAVNEDSNVHTAETGQVAPVRQVSLLAGYTSAPEIAGLTGISMPGAPDKMLLMWQPSQWADHYLIEQSSDGVKWTRTGETRASNYTATALYGNNTMIRVAAVGVARGPWVQISYGLLADYMWAANDATPMWNATDTTLMWRF